MGFGLRYRERLDEGTADELNKFMKFLKQFLLLEHNEDGTHFVTAPTSNVAPKDQPYVTVGNSADLSAERALTGTANQVTVTDNGANSTVQLGLPQSIGTGSSPEFTDLTLSGTTASRLLSTNGSKLLASVANLASWIAGTSNQITVGDDGDGSVTLSTPQNIHTSASPQFTALLLGGAAGGATSAHTIIKKITDIDDAVATDILTVTVPNADHAAAVKLTFLSSNGNGDSDMTAFESSRVATGHVVVARTTDANAVTAAATIDDAAIATVAGGATHTLAYDLSSISGAAGAVNTFTIRVTINDSLNLGSNQLVVFATLINSEATGVTIA